MKHTTVPLFLLAWTLALVGLSSTSLPAPSKASPEAPKARPQWEYASLAIGNAGADIRWEAGRTTLESPGDVARPDLGRSVADLYRQMGGNAEKPTLGILLNRIGREGWEMVSYAHTSGAQVWMFKRAGQ